MERELAILTAQTSQPWGIGFLTWAINTDTIVWALDQHPHAIMLAFGDPGPYAARIRAAGVPFVPLVVDLAAPTPVLAAGGIADDRGLAAALAFGAAGALIGTRFQASHEALVPAEITKARVLDLARGSDWPANYTARVLRNPFLDRWRDKEDEVAHDPEAHQAYSQAVDTNDINTISIWCSEAIDLITEIDSAEDLVRRLATDAATALARAASSTPTID